MSVDNAVPVEGEHNGEHPGAVRTVPVHTGLMDQELVIIARELAEITRLVENDDFGATLDRFVARIVRLIPGCDRAILTVRSAGTVETVAGGDGLEFDPIAPGPVVEAVTYGEPRRLDDVASDQRWPTFAVQIADVKGNRLRCRSQHQADRATGTEPWSAAVDSSVRCRLLALISTSSIPGLDQVRDVGVDPGTLPHHRRERLLGDAQVTRDVHTRQHSWAIRSETRARVHR